MTQCAAWQPHWALALRAETLLPTGDLTEAEKKRGEKGSGQLLPAAFRWEPGCLDYSSAQDGTLKLSKELVPSGNMTLYPGQLPLST